MANNVHLRSSANGFDFHSQVVLQRRKRHQFVEQRFESFFVAFEHHCFFETLKHRNLPEPVHSRFQTVIPTSTSITVREFLVLTLLRQTILKRNRGSSILSLGGFYTYPRTVARLMLEVGSYSLWSLRHASSP